MFRLWIPWLYFAMTVIIWYSGLNDSPPTTKTESSIEIDAYFDKLNNHNYQQIWVRPSDRSRAWARPDSHLDEKNSLLIIRIIVDLCPILTSKSFQVDPMAISWTFMTRFIWKPLWMDRKSLHNCVRHHKHQERINFLYN